MSHAIFSRPAKAEPGSIRFATRLASALRPLLHEVASTWRYAAARREFASLDAATLRDLAMSHGEFDSYWAETHGLAEPTRRRVTQDKCKGE
jgi:hypothetical protein